MADRHSPSFCFWENFGNWHGRSWTWTNDIMGQSHAFCRTELYAKIGRPDRIRTCDTSELRADDIKKSDITSERRSPAITAGN